MTPRQGNTPRQSDEPTADLAAEQLTEQERNELENSDKQEAYRKALIAQLRAQQCPGCGEGDLF